MLKNCALWWVEIHLAILLLCSYVEYLRGFEVFAQTSFTISESSSQSFEWKGYGLKLHVPEGTFSEEKEEYKINIKAGLDGQFEFPDNSQLVSCIYWLSCPQKFLKPVTLEIWHCALIQNQSQSSGLQFVVAKCSQPELPYKFKALDKGAFSAHSSYGSIQVSQFSLFGLISIFWSPRRYYSTLHYVRKGIKSWHVDIAVTWNHPAHLQVSSIPDACTYMKLSPQQTPLNLKLEGRIQRLTSFTSLWSPSF